MLCFSYDYIIKIVCILKFLYGVLLWSVIIIEPIMHCQFADEINWYGLIVKLNKIFTRQTLMSL